MQRPRRGAAQLDFSIDGWCAAPLYGLAAPPVLRVYLTPEVTLIASYGRTPPVSPVPPTCCGCSSTRTESRAAILYFGRHRDKPGVGYTCSLRAMSCVSRALPDLHPAATRAAKHMQPRSTTAQGHEGVRGGSSKLSLNIYLSLSPLANSPLGRRDRQMTRRHCCKAKLQPQ